MIVRFEMNFEVVAAGEGASAMLTLVAFVARVQFDVAIATPLVLEGPITKTTRVDGVLSIQIANKHGCC